MSHKRYGILSLFLLTLLTTVTAQQRGEQELIAASQAGASFLYFNPGDTTVPLVSPGTWSNGNECTVRGGLPHFFRKAAAGQPLTIGFIGGSITQGNACYRPQAARYIQAMFPGTAMKGINAGVSGTGTDLGACRLQGQLLQYHPDLVFVEFAVNGAYPEGMEGIIRQIRRASPQTDICLIYTINNGQTKIYTAGGIPENIQRLERLAAYYQLPSIHLGMEVAQLEQEGKLLWKSAEDVPGKIVFSRDGTHPITAGGNLYAAAMARGMHKIQTAGDVDTLPLPAPLLADNWEDAGMYDPQEIAVFGDGWKKTATDQLPLRQFHPWFPYVMTAAQPGAAFTFRFTGTLFGIFDIGGPEAGQLEAVVDGKVMKLACYSPQGTHFLSEAKTTDSSGSVTINRFNYYCNNRYRGQHEMILLPPGKHTVTLRLAAQKADKRKILGSTQQEDITHHPEKYDRTVVYIGKILLRGKPGF
ncbi:SGNH/GDSL hydrolase family protein [Chitinophaga qingshengii]|uniref:SGNH/GDSL hydrolase family protein n=1 Tax=Chitinophaga qingshengii TaxID=1569794 RepID=A0ABR7TNH1_9BACT|nr:SGNH/GDSL hydrolase family protein [Chitinophaga qingshengii]MBC9932031.1 SGNH/GDSL hydrolase family protein [Chitinophaga qingshengii]